MPINDHLNPPIYIPDYLRRYLIEVPVDPKARILSTRAAKQQKVRYLYRRFLSQINHGCNNPNCDTPTCLSYRKRMSTGVIRPYTSLSASALALQCVEDYGYAVRSKQSNVKILCNNTPVVPWYEHAEARYTGTRTQQRSKDGSLNILQPAKEKKDHAAFMQQLFDQPELRQLQELDFDAQLTEPISVHVKGKQKAGQISPNVSEQQTSNTVSTTTINLLGTISAQVLHWFILETGAVPEDEISPEDTSDVRRVKENSQFFDRCVAHMFSHPRTCSSSIMHWGSILGRPIPDDTPEWLPLYLELRRATFMLCTSMAGDAIRLLRYSFECLQHPHVVYLSTHPDAICGKDALDLSYELVQLIFFHEAIARSTQGYIITGHSEQPALGKQSEHGLVERHTQEIANIMSARLTLELIAHSQRHQPKVVKLGHAMIQLFKTSLLGIEPLASQQDRAGFFAGYLYRLFEDSWDYNPIIQRSGNTYVALEMLRTFYIKRDEFGLPDNCFYMPMPEEVFDELEMPYEWYHFRPTTQIVHILQYPFIFSPRRLVTFFRSLNLKLMKMAHEKAMTERANAKAQLMYGPWHPKSANEVMDKVRPHMAKFFVMSIRRDHILQDAIGQIWQREAQEITRPLRVKLGEDEGEEGLDHGGVQQELFRLIFAEALDEKYGMFTTDPTTHMSWFNPTSVEPLYKYEALGILLALAVYNGVVVPITFPLAFYRKVLGLKVKSTQDICDGWPGLAKSFDDLLAWEGNVLDDMGLSYEFSYDAFGERKSIDMSKQQHHADSSPSDPASTSYDAESPPVTNENRKMFVKDYISHLTDITIRPQFTAFVHGMRRLLSPEALSLFPPATLKQLIEGQPTDIPLDIDEWRSIVDYDNGYSDSCEVIQWFWDILRHEFNQDQLRSLLAFVTASDRLPVDGWSGMTFTIIKNGEDIDGRLPTSSTCYGKLLLPRYSSRDVLKDRLEWATSQAWGFWMV